MVPKHNQILIPVNFRNLYGKVELEDMIKLGILRWEDHPRLSRWTLNAHGRQRKL
jgi:hypothetical protein